jgi:hypothetical protein
MECIVHFKVIYPQETKMLRGLVFLESGQRPSINDFLGLFSRMGYDVKLTDEKDLIFKPVSGTKDYTLDIVRVELDDEDGEAKSYEDQQLRAILEQLIRK